MENNNLPANVRPEDLPSVITQTFNGIENIDKKVLDSENKAKNAQESAKEAKSKSAGWSFFGSDKKEAIEALQVASVDQADALSSSIEASKELFENQKKMTQAINYLFGLGVVNIAANRTVVQQLEMKLRNASKSELSEFARKEIESVILQLRAQEDIQNRINGHDALLREHKACIDANTSSVNSLKNDISRFKTECKQTLSSLIDVQSTIEQVRREATNALDNLPSKLSDMERKLKEASATEVNDQIRRAKEDIDSKFKQETTRLQTSFSTLQSETNKIQQSVNSTITLVGELKSKQEAAIVDAKQQIEEQITKINADFDVLKMKQSALVEELKNGQEERLSELETNLQKQISEKMESSFSAIRTQMESIENSISRIQEQLDNKSFFDSSLFKILLTMLVVLSIVLHFIPLL